MICIIFIGENYSYNVSLRSFRFYNNPRLIPCRQLDQSLTDWLTIAICLWDAIHPSIHYAILATIFTGPNKKNNNDIGMITIIISLLSRPEIQLPTTTTSSSSCNYTTSIRIITCLSLLYYQLVFDGTTYWSWSWWTVGVIGRKNVHLIEFRQRITYSCVYLINGHQIHLVSSGYSAASPLCVCNWPIILLICLRRRRGRRQANCKIFHRR